MNDIMVSLSPPERRAVAIIAIAIRLHGGVEGDGLFTGKGRYEVLQSRVQLAAESSRDVRMFWDRLSASMLWRVTATAHDDAVLALIRPADDDPEVLRAFAERQDSLLRIARHLVRGDKAAAKADAVPPRTPVFEDPLDAFFAVTAN